MKKLILISLTIFALFGVSQAYASTRVSDYFKKSGTYVMSHYRSDADSTRINNWSSKGNYNPFTGKKGTKSPFRVY